MKRLLLSVLFALSMMSLAGCMEDTDADKAQDDQVARQMSVKVNAVEAVPAYVPTHFPARAAMSKFMERTNDPAMVWYIYKESRATGEIIAAYTSSIYPMSVCSFMTPTEEFDVEGRRGHYGVMRKQAIALDGMYYGAGGECPTFFFDLVTDTLVVVDEDVVLSAYDQPIDVDVEITSFKPGEN